METLQNQIEKAFTGKVVQWTPRNKIKKILLIDDCKVSALSAALLKEGYHVLHCESVKQAWGCIYPHPPHLIVVRLDNLNGAALADLQECWALAEGVPIILATSAQLDPTVMKAVQHRAAGVLSLPAMLKGNGERNERRASMRKKSRASGRVCSL
jgi:DNA-binding NtrC family response regulator